MNPRLSGRRFRTRRLKERRETCVWSSCDARWVSPLKPPRPSWHSRGGGYWRRCARTRAVTKTATTTSRRAPRCFPRRSTRLRTRGGFAHRTLMATTRAPPGVVGTDTAPARGSRQKSASPCAFWRFTARQKRVGAKVRIGPFPNSKTVCAYTTDTFLFHSQRSPRRRLRVVAKTSRKRDATGFWRKPRERTCFLFSRTALFISAEAPFGLSNAYGTCCGARNRWSGAR